MTKKLLILLSYLILSSFTISANHILGGTLSYKFYSSSKGKVSYLVKLSLFLNCHSSAVSADKYILLGIYNNDMNKSLYRTDTIYISNYTTYNPNCNSTASACIQIYNYSKKIDVDSSSSGYFLYYSRCCRTLDLLNVYNSNTYTPGLIIFTYVPPSANINSSPDFIFQPTALIGLNKTEHINLEVSELDGDSLVYEIVSPLSSNYNNQPLPIPEAYMNKMNSVIYNSGFSKDKPLGDSVLVSIDRVSGILTIKNPIEGSFAFCIEIREYRKAKLIGISRKDYPLIFSKKPFYSSKDTIILDKPIVWGWTKVRLKWETCPVSNPEFVIERKQKGLKWSEIYKGKDMYFDDSISDSTWYYYQVKASIHGKYIYSIIDSANNRFVGNTGNIISNINRKTNIHPNPANDYLIVEENSINSCEIYDYLGNLILEYTNINKNNKLRLNVSSLKRGFYVLVLKTENSTFINKFIKN